MLTKHAMKRKQPQSASSRKAPRTGRQSKLTHHSFGFSEQCPHCSQRFSSLQQLIDHVESTHSSGANCSDPADEGAVTKQEEHWTAALLANSPAEQHERHQAQQQQLPTLQPQQQQPEPNQHNQDLQQQHQPHQTTWWKQRPADPVVAHIRFTSSAAGSQALQPVRLSALSSVASVELLLQALPSNLANSLLTELLGQSGAWVAGSWWFGGQQQTAPRSSAHYILQAQDTDSHQLDRHSAAVLPDSHTQTVHQHSHHSQHVTPPSTAEGAYGRAAAGATAAEGVAAAAPPPPAAAAAAQGGQATSTGLSSLPQLPASPTLQTAANLISRAVSSRMSSPQHRLWQQQRQAVTAQLLDKAITTAAAAAAGGCPPHQEPQQRAELPWQPSYVLANFYRDGQQSVGSHTDRLGSLGPLPTIASVSLGAGRVFRLHPADSNVGAAAAAAAAGGAAGGGVSGSSSGGSSGRVVSSIDIHLPHNSLLIMWPPTQEQWKHEVPKTKSVTSHLLSGPARINLTFRQLQPPWAAAVPQCRCGRQAIMRCGLQGGSFVYYYACDNTQGPGCGMYKAAVTLKPAG